MIQLPCTKDAYILRLEIWNCNLITDDLIGESETVLNPQALPLGEPVDIELSCGGAIEFVTYHGKEHLGKEPHIGIPALLSAHQKENEAAQPAPPPPSPGGGDDDEADDSPSTMRRLTAFFSGESAEEEEKKQRRSMPAPQPEPDDSWNPVRRISSMF